MFIGPRDNREVHWVRAPNGDINNHRDGTREAQSKCSIRNAKELLKVE
jgi:hypothetical protein